MIDRVVRKLTGIEQLKYFIKWSVIALIMGVIIGIVSNSFAFAIIYVTLLWHKYLWIRYMAPFSGLLIVYIYRRAKVYQARGTNLVIDSISTGESIPMKMAPLIYISTILTHLIGGSSGREGAALQLGGSLGHCISNWFSLNERDRKTAIMCGMAACFAAVFGTPIAAGIFCIELYSVGTFYVSTLIPCLFAAYVAAGVSTLTHLELEKFTVVNVLNWDIISASKIIVLAILSAIIAVLFCYILHQSEHIYRQFIQNPYLRVVVGSILFILITSMIGNADYNGGGFNLVIKSMRGTIGAEAFIIKILMTAIVLGCGFKGGEIVPCLSVGACFGSVVGAYLGIPIELATACGMIALFVGVTNCPIASIFLAIELFGISGLNFYVLCVIVSFVFSGYCGLYSSQKVTYSKTDLEYIGNKSK